jgi:hypothetical protein
MPGVPPSSATAASRRLQQRAFKISIFQGKHPQTASLATDSE